MEKLENEYQKFADEVFQKLDSIIRYNNLQSVKENTTYKAIWFGDKINLLWGVVKVQQIENKIMCYDSDEQLINIIFVAREIPEDVDLELFEVLDSRVLVIPMLYNLEKMTDKLHNGKIRIYIIDEYANERIEYNRYVQFPKVERM